MDWNRVDRESKELTKKMLFGELEEDCDYPIAIHNHIANRAQWDGKIAFTQFEKATNRKRFYVRRAILTALSAAAIVLLVHGSILLVDYLGLVSNNKKSIASTELSDVEPVSKKARLILSDGFEIDLGRVNNSTFTERGKSINIGVDRVDYTSGETLEELEVERALKRVHREPVFNTIDIPRGGEYSLTLEDGTEVWLNSDSRLKFPISFIGESREIYLEGEAYFKVAPNVEKPFIVKIKSGDIKVLGTSFNIKNYPEESEIKTTLVEGAITFTGSHGVETELAPGEQLVYYPDANYQEIREVNVEDVISWKEKYFRFEQMTLEEIMNSLSRWYDISITFEKPCLRSMRFSGNLDRYDSVTSFLKVFEVGGDLQFTYHGNHLTVDSKYHNVGKRE